MKCGYPLTIYPPTGKRLVSCGQCMPCRINKKREWKGRLLLEAAHMTSPGSFVTLTYDGQHLPKNGSVLVSDAQNWMKRLRERLRSSMGHSIRYFTVGEYGDKNWRPHYHCLLFNVDPSIHEKQIRDSWGMGIVDVGSLETGACDYVCDYTTKRLTLPDDPRLEGRNREFFLSTRRPVIGHTGYLQLLDAMYTRSGSVALVKRGDVPSSFRLGGRTFPIAKTWRRRLRLELGIERTAGDKLEEQIIEFSKSTEQRMLEAMERNDEQAKATQQAEKLWRERKRKRRPLH